MHDTVTAVSPRPLPPLALPPPRSPSHAESSLNICPIKSPPRPLAWPTRPCRSQTEQQIAEAMKTLGITPTDADRPVLTQLVLDELLGFGPIQPLLDDPSVTEVMVNRADRVYVERKGKPFRTDISLR